MSKKVSKTIRTGSSQGTVYPLAPTNKRAKNKIPMEGKKGFNVVTLKIPTKDLRKALKKAGRAKEFSIVGFRKTGKVSFSAK